MMIYRFGHVAGFGLWMIKPAVVRASCLQWLVQREWAQTVKLVHKHRVLPNKHVVCISFNTANYNLSGLMSPGCGKEQKG
jgi:hypothetical protein